MVYRLIFEMAGVFASAVLRGFTGFGFGLAAVPLLSLALPPAEVVPLVVTLQLPLGLAGLRAATTMCDWRTVKLLFPGLVLGVPVGLLILTTLPANLVRLAIGSIIALSVWLICRGVRLPPDPSRPVSFATGVVSGIMSGLAGMGGPPVVIYLLALGHNATRMRATAIVYFMLAACVAFLPMAARGMITRDILATAAASLPVLLGGSQLGAWAFARATPQHHRIVALTTLSVLSALLVGRALLR